MAANSAIGSDGSARIAFANLAQPNDFGPHLETVTPERVRDTAVPPGTVPEPAALPLIGLGLVGMALGRRKTA